MASRQRKPRPRETPESQKRILAAAAKIQVRAETSLAKLIINEFRDSALQGQHSGSMVHAVHCSGRVWMLAGSEPTLYSWSEPEWEARTRYSDLLWNYVVGDSRGENARREGAATYSVLTTNFHDVLGAFQRALAARKTVEARIAELIAYSVEHQMAETAEHAPVRVSTSGAALEVRSSVDGQLHLVASAEANLSGRDLISPDAPQPSEQILNKLLLESFEKVKAAFQHRAMEWQRECEKQETMQQHTDLAKQFVNRVLSDYSVGSTAWVGVRRFTVCSDSEGLYLRSCLLRPVRIAPSSPSNTSGRWARECRDSDLVRYLDRQHQKVTKRMGTPNDSSRTGTNLN